MEEAYTSHCGDMTTILSRVYLDSSLPAPPVLRRCRRVRFQSSSSAVVVRLPLDMRIVWAVPCAEIVRRPEGGYDARMAGLTDAVVDDLPATIQFMILFRLGLQRASVPESCRMTFEVFDSDGQSVFRHAGPATFENPSPVAEEDEIFSDLPMPFAFVANRPGLHRVVVSVDGEEATEFPLRVVAA